LQGFLQKLQPSPVTSPIIQTEKHKIVSNNGTNSWDSQGSFCSKELFFIY